MKVKAATEKNFRRAKAAPVKRRRGAIRLTWRALRHAASLAFVLYAGWRAAALVLGASPLQVSHVVVRGNVRLSSGEVDALVHNLYGTSILTTDLSALRRRLLESPWVAEVALRRVLPSTIEVVVSERRPIGICRVGSQLYLIDRHGTLIDEFGPEYAEFDLPILDGLIRSPRQGKPMVDETRAELAARVIDAVAGKPEIARRISQIDVRDLHDAVVLLEGDPAMLHLGEERFLERLHSYVQVASALRERIPDIDYVDLRFEQRVYVRPQRAATGGKRPSADGRTF
jgi:cell division protein FtsQ